MSTKSIPFLLITGNVGSLFEHPETINGWFDEIFQLLEKYNPSIVAFHFQELGGKDSALLSNMNLFTTAIADTIDKTTNEDKYFSTGVIYEYDLSSPNFTAIGSLFLIRTSISSDVSVWDFKEEVYKPFIILERSVVINASSCHYIQHKRFQGTRSRKGFLRSRWKFGNQELNMINIHLYHDDLNTVATSSIPSIYADNRAKALLEIVSQCNLIDRTPTFLFGDFNIRLDADFINWIKTEQNRTDFENNGNCDSNSSLLLVKEKEFYYKFSTELFNDKIKLQKILEFDREIQRFNESQDIKLEEADVKFGPTYCIDGKKTNEIVHIYANKRIPAWCDRIMFTKNSEQIFEKHIKNVEYQAIFGNHTLGDHTPVYLYSHLTI